MPIAAAIPPSVYKWAAWPIFIAALGLQSLVLTPLAHTSRGNSNWVNLGGITVQPSEFLKLAVALWLAVIIGRKTREEMKNPRLVAVPAGIGAVAALGGVLAGRDVGTAIIFVLDDWALLLAGRDPLQMGCGSRRRGGNRGGTAYRGGGIRLNRCLILREVVRSLRAFTIRTQSEYAMWAFGTGGIGEWDCRCFQREVELTFPKRTMTSSSR